MKSTVIATLALISIAPMQAGAEVRLGLAAELTGKVAWLGEQDQRGLELAVADVNEAGGVLGQTVEVVLAEDHCDAEQAVAAAHKLIADDVVAVIGHGCSGAAIAASPVYEEAGVLMISPTATNPKLTDQGFRHIFRMVARDTLQAQMTAEYLAKEWAHGRIAILHDGGAYGQGLAEETKRQLNARGVREVIFGQITPGQTDYTTDLTRLEAAGVDVLFYGGLTEETALLIRQARSAGDDLQLIGSDTLVTEFFWLVAGSAAAGVRFVSMADPRTNEEAASVVEQFRAQGYEPEGVTLYSYAAVQVWAQAVEKAGTFEAKAVAEALRSDQFDTVLGHIGFDDNGDVTGYQPFTWYVWKEGRYEPAAID